MRRAPELCLAQRSSFNRPKPVVPVQPANADHCQSVIFAKTRFPLCAKKDPRLIPLRKNRKNGLLEKPGCPLKVRPAAARRITNRLTQKQQAQISQKTGKRCTNE